MPYLRCTRQGWEWFGELVGAQDQQVWILGVGVIAQLMDPFVLRGSGISGN